METEKSQRLLELVRKQRQIIADLSMHLGRTSAACKSAANVIDPSGSHAPVIQTDEAIGALAYCVTWGEDAQAYLRELELNAKDVDTEQSS